MSHISILPTDQYHRLPLAVDPVTSIVVINEDVDSKEITDYWVAQAVVHIEPIALTSNDGGFTAIRMLAVLLSALAEKGDPMFYAFADRPEIAGYLERLGMTALPYNTYVGINPLLKDK